MNYKLDKNSYNISNDNISKVEIATSMEMYMKICLIA